MRKDERNVFADPRRQLPGARLGDHFDVVSAARCEGALARLEPLPTRPASARFSGRAWDRAADRPPAFVVAADEHGVIRGLANLGRGGARGFRGTLLRPSQRHALYAVLADGRSACPFAGVLPAR
jgi:hypothetical protein